MAFSRAIPVAETACPSTFLDPPWYNDPMKKLKWGILGTGKIARRLAKTLQTSRSGVLAAVASREEPKALEFAREFGPAAAHGDYQSLLEDPSVEAVYIATPHPAHAEWNVRAANAGRHILCEKPATMNARELETVLDSVRKNQVFFMEAFMYRPHPQTSRIVEIIRSGVLGEVRLIRATFSFQSDSSRESRLVRRELGGGAILDVGCYCASMSRLIAGAALFGDKVAEPTEVHGVGWLDEAEGTDLLACALLKFPGKITAQLSAGTQLNQTNHVLVHGTQGMLRINQPWFAGSQGATLEIHRQGGEAPEIQSTESPADLYSAQFDLVAAYCHRGQAPFPAPTWEDSLGNMKVLDAWRKSLGVVYEADRPCL